MGGYEDTDTELTKHNDYNDDGYVTVSVSQYSQINATKNNGGESTSPSRPGSYAVSTANQNAVASGGDDYRWDVIEASSAATGAAGDDPSQTVTVNTATTHSSAAFRSDCLRGTHTFGTHSIAQGGTDRVRALAAVRYRLVAPAGPAVAAQSPIIYVAAWYTHSIPQEAAYNVGHDEYTHTGHDTQADGSAYAETTNTRRLRSARTLLRAAAAEGRDSTKRFARSSASCSLDALDLIPYTYTSTPMRKVSHMTHYHSESPYADPCSPAPCARFYPPPVLIISHAWEAPLAAALT